MVSGLSESLVVPMSVAATGDARLNEYSAGESFSAAVSGRGRMHSTAQLDYSSRLPVAWAQTLNRPLCGESRRPRLFDDSRTLRAIEDADDRLSPA